MNSARIDNAPATLYDLARAQKIAAEMQAGDEDGWTYTAIPVGDAGRAVVEVADENGEVVGRV